MKLLLTAITAATLTATSAFAITTPEDRAVIEDQRINGLMSSGTEIMVEPTFKLTGRIAIADDSEKVTLTKLEGAIYDERNEVGRR